MSDEKNNEPESASPTDGGCPSLATTTADARALFMLWQDTDELRRFLGRSGLTWEAFRTTPLARASVLQLLGVVGLHARGVGNACATRLAARVDWRRVRALARLADDRTAHSLDDDALADAWSAATTLSPTLRCLVANDIAVVRMRARWERLMARDQDAWPQPDPTHKPTAADATRLGQVSRALAGVISRSWGGTFPARRIWLLHDPDEGDHAAPQATTLAVEHHGTCSAQDAQRLHDMLAQELGTPVNLIPQEQIHPLIWDETVAGERVAWESADASEDGRTTVPAVCARHDHGQHDAGSAPQQTR
ncbi:MAG: hypothetical protein PHR15_03920 [Atopobiaceae bacterium]|jgi:hypothetical protein|nr:hypothetical protein [Atopobiaceae bacterium]MCH4180179.1 hypothetical protein [Atopobiaceae bacterium]MCH4214349.1 hypothetical protein [Atopobiaceae bacterium]MCH4229220.1 hypothetical protein [Atopobiaceae bacterium]MCH4276591.1 hypothetical protein [Atopobiaceae bacterium]